MLVSLSDMRAYLGIGSGDTSNDGFLTAQLELLSDIVEEYLGRKLLEDTYTQTLYSDYFRTRKNIVLPQYPVTEITSFKTKELVDVVDYRLSTKYGIITSDYSNYAYLRTEELTIEYKAGYSTVPSTILYVVKAIVAERYNKKISGIELEFGRDVQRISIPGAVSIDFDYTLTANDRQSPFGMVLGNYMNLLDKFRSENRLVGPGVMEYVS